MTNLATAAVLATHSDTVPARAVASDIGKRMEHLLETPPTNLLGEGEFHLPRAFWSKHRYFTTAQRVLRVEVCVDLDQLDDLVYKDSLVRDAKRAAVDFLTKNEEADL